METLKNECSKFTKCYHIQKYTPTHATKISIIAIYIPKYILHYASLFQNLRRKAEKYIHVYFFTKKK